MIKKRDVVGKLFTSSGDFMILKWGFRIIGVEARELHYDIDLDVDYYPNRSGTLKIQGNYIYKEFPQPKKIYIYVKENEK